MNAVRSYTELLSENFALDTLARARLRRTETYRERAETTARALRTTTKQIAGVRAVLAGLHCTCGLIDEPCICCRITQALLLENKTA